MSRSIGEKVSRAFYDEWLYSKVRNVVLDDWDITVIRDHLKKEDVKVTLSDDEISCLWRSNLKTNCPVIWTGYSKERL